MKAARLLPICLSLGALIAVPGCLAPKSQLTECQTQNRAMAEQCRAQLAEIENLKTHSKNLGEQLMRTEKELALMQEEVGLDRQQLANYQEERSELHQQFQGLVGGRARLSPEMSRQLADLSSRYPVLQFDPATGISKLDTDILFDSGDAELKPGAEQMLAELARVLKSSEACDLKIMVVGHTDDQQMAKRPARERFPDNFHLSTARALAVARLMQQQGIAQNRLGVAGFGSHQPIAPNITARDRQKNRRVEIFVMNRDVPVVGWTESIPSVY